MLSIYILIMLCIHINISVFKVLSISSVICSELFFLTTSMDDNEIFEDCLDEQSTTDTVVTPLDELKEWIKSHGKFPKNIRKFNVGH